MEQTNDIFVEKSFMSLVDPTDRMFATQERLQFKIMKIQYLLNEIKNRKPRALKEIKVSDYESSEESPERPKIDFDSKQIKLPYIEPLMPPKKIIILDFENKVDMGT